MAEQIYTNAKIVLADEVIHGSIAVNKGHITDISESPSQLPQALDMGNDYVMPGLVELHTDNLEKHMTPRPKTEWPPIAAAVAHDNQVASAGITTVFDAIAVGDVHDGSARIKRLNDSINSLADAKEKNLLRADHLVHLRCEVSFSGIVDIPHRL